MSKVLVVGSSVVDLTFYTQRIPSVGETVTGKFSQGLGGKGFNQAVGSRLAGAPTVFVSALGEDVFAGPFRSRLQDLGIESSIETVKDASTGTATISVDDSGRNSIIVALGANGRLSSEFLTLNEQLFENTRVLLLQFEVSLEVIDCALQLVRKKSPDCLTILNPAPALPKIPGSILENVDFLTPNETELELISGHKLRTSEDLKKVCEEIPIPSSILATLGDRGCFYFRRLPKGAETRALPAFGVNALDTSGAGDAFNGAFACGLLEHSGNWEKAAIFASAAAAISVTRPGTSASMASRPEIDLFLQRNT